MIKVQHSVVSPDALLKVIQKSYPAIGAIKCELMELGCNDTYHVKTKRKEYAFRLYRLNWWPEQQVDEELRLLEIFDRKKLRVAKPVRNSDKKRYISVKAPEGLRYGALFSFIAGQHLGFHLGKSTARLVELGRVVAEMHTVADQIKQPVQRWTIGFDNVVREFLDNAPVVLAHRPKDINYLHKLAAQLEKVLLDQPEGAFNFGLCHGDLHLHNVMLQPDGELALFDFDWCGYSWRAYDIATLWWALARNKKPASHMRAIVRGYTQVRPLSKQEKTLMQWFVVFRHFEFLNFQLSMRKHIGTGWLNDAYYNFHIKFFKDWVRDHL